VCVRAFEGILNARARRVDAAIDAGGTSGKLQTLPAELDQWPRGHPHLGVPARPVAAAGSNIRGQVTRHA